MFTAPYNEVEKVRYCSKCKKVKSTHRKEKCTCPKKKEELKG